MVLEAYGSINSVSTPAVCSSLTIINPYAHIIRFILGFTTQNYGYEQHLLNLELNLLAYSRTPYPDSYDHGHDYIIFIAPFIHAFIPSSIYFIPR